MLWKERKEGRKEKGKRKGREGRKGGGKEGRREGKKREGKPAFYRSYLHRLVVVRLLSSV